MSYVLPIWLFWLRRQISYRPHMILLGQVLLIGCTIPIGFWIQMPWAGLVALALLAVESVSVARRRSVNRWGLLTIWSALVVVGVSLLLAKNHDEILDLWRIALCWLNSAAFLIVCLRQTDALSARRCKVVTISWAFLGGAFWLASAYVANRFLYFHGGLLMLIVLLIIYRIWLRPGATGTQVANTFILLLVSLPLVDLYIRPNSERIEKADTSRKYYLYENGRMNPSGFAAWRTYLGRQWESVANRICETVDAEKGIPVKLRPNSQTKFFDGRVSINSKGFRGKEIAVEKGDTYRIVALGESTTFGATFNDDDHPWPERLEAMIRERLNPGRPVEVINAGIPSCNLVGNLTRISSDILPLQPDMIISYHGYNGFHLIHKSLPLSYGRRSPELRERPLKILAHFEFRLHSLVYRKIRSMKLGPVPATLPDPMQTEYAQAYGKLIEVARTNKIRLVLANYCMAVNSNSVVDVVEFYRQIFPEAPLQIKANEVHSSIVLRMAQLHPGVIAIDTHPGLDGDHHKFIDLMHLTPEGRQQLAEAIYAGIKQTINTAVGPTRQPQ